MLYHYVKDTNAREEKITCLHCCKLVRVPICREIEVELQLWRGDAIRRIERSHMSDTSHA